MSRTACGVLIDIDRVIGCKDTQKNTEIRHSVLYKGELLLLNKSLENISALYYIRKQVKVLRKLIQNGFKRSMRNFYKTDYVQCYDKDLVYKLNKTCSHLEWFSVISGITENCKQCTLYTVHCTLYTVHCTLYTVHCTLYTVHCTLYTVHCTLYTVHCTLIFILNRNFIQTNTNIGTLNTYINISYNK